MDAMTIERARSGRSTGAARVVAYLGGAAFAVAAAWYALAANGVTVAAEPRALPDQSVQQHLAMYFSWFVSTLQQERLYTGIAIAAFLCLMVTAAFLRDRLGRRGPLASVGAVAIGAGAGLWVVGKVLQLGGHQAVGLMATHGNPIGAVNSIAFTIDTVDHAFELAAFALIGLGMVALARSAMRAGSEHLAWGAGTLAVGLVLVALSGSQAANDGSLADVLLLAGGIVLLPAWLAWTGGLLRSPDGSPHAS